MVKAQEWLDKNYPKSERKTIAELNLSNRNLESDLEIDFSDFTKLVKIDVSGNPELGQVKLKEDHFFYLDFIDKDGQCKGYIGKEVINQIKDFKHSFISYNEKNENEKHNKLTLEQESLIDQLISNQRLRKRYKMFGLCKECQQPNTGKDEFGRGWCQPCNAQHFQVEFDNWTSGNLEIDKFVQKQQSEATDNYKVLEWIPYEQFTNVEQIGEGGFAKVYKAKWTDGPIFDWNIISNNWGRYNRGNEVVLRFLNNSQDIKAFLKEVNCHKLVNDDSITPLYGISQDLVTKNYIMVTDWIPQGDMKSYLKKGRGGGLRAKLYYLYSINKGLNSIHQQRLVHKDFHSGNLLVSSNYNPSKFFIADFGLSGLANEKDEEGKIFGVLPYVAPEVLRGQPYTQASDIYSFGIIAYELLANSYPYATSDLESNNLALSICRGLRPNIDELKIPQLLKNLIKSCWDADSTKRPTTSEIWSILYEWISGIDNKENTEFAQQYKEVESEYNQFSQNAPYCIHASAVTTSKAINTKQITELLQEYSNSLQMNFQNLSLEDESEQVSQQEIPPKK